MNDTNGKDRGMPGGMGEKLVRGVLARTSGSPCGRARELLAARADNPLAALDTTLLSAHTEHCAACRSLAAVLAWMPRPLLELAEVDPGEAFTAATLRNMLPWRRRAARRLRGLGVEWAGLLRRPRIAWEAAYVGAAIIGLLFASPSSPLRNVPGEALRVAQANPVQAFVEISRRQLPETLTTWGDAAWAASGGRVGTAARSWRDELWDRLARGWQAGAPLTGDTGDLGAALWASEGDRVRDAIGRIKNDLAAVKTELTSAGARKNPHKQKDSSGERHG